jgi:hypothetical protein
MSLRSARALSLAALVLVGCSGAAGSDLFAADQTATSPTDPSPTGTGTTTPEPTPPLPDGGTIDPPPVVPDAGRPDVDPPTPTCTPEAEPNNDLAHATPFTASFCGKIAGSNDVDFGRFVVPQNAKSMAISHSENGGKVNYRYYLNGQLLALSDSIDAIPGATYTVQIKLATGSGNGNGTPSYQLDVAFK